MSPLGLAAASSFCLLCSSIGSRALAREPCLVFFPGHETQRRGVDAIAQSGGSGTVVENMAEVRAVNRTAHLGAGHPKARIGLRDDEFRLDRLGETGPAGAAVELVAAVKQRGVAADRKKDPILVVVPIGVAER